MDQPAVLFSGAAYIWAPAKVVDMMITVIGASYSFFDDQYVVKCSKAASLPDILLMLGTAAVRVPSKHYLRKVSKSAGNPRIIRA